MTSIANELGGVSSLNGFLFFYALDTYLSQDVSYDSIALALTVTWKDAPHLDHLSFGCQSPQLPLRIHEPPDVLCVRL